MLWRVLHVPSDLVRNKWAVCPHPYITDIDCGSFSHACSKTGWTPCRTFYPWHWALHHVILFYPYNPTSLLAGQIRLTNSQEGLIQLFINIPWHLGREMIRKPKIALGLYSLSVFSIERCCWGFFNRMVCNLSHQMRVDIVCCRAYGYSNLDSQ